MKKLLPLIMVLMLICSFSFSQNAETTTPTISKASRPILYNDVYGGYGAFSVFYFTGNFSHSYNPLFATELSDEQSAGCFYIGYNRTLNKVVSTGFMFGYQNFSRNGTGNTNSSSVTVNDNLLMGMARVTFCYLDKPVIRMYSGVGIGITIDLGTEQGNGGSVSDRKLLPGGQITLMGLRFGRAFGGFVEFGFGTYGIVNAGLSYKFKD
jgi:hypothetical protein